MSLSGEIPRAVERPPRSPALRPARLAAWPGLALALLLALPVVWVAAHLLVPLTPIGRDLLASVIPGYAWTSAVLAALVASGAVLVGVPAAWLIATTRFPGRDLLGWLLVLPLAVPAYILAWIYFDLLGAAGPVRAAVAAATGLAPRDLAWLSVASLPGAAVILTTALYPYVYLAARAAFSEQSAAPLETARMLGCGPWGVFRRVALPLARPAIAAGAALVIMETLADFGTVSFLGVPTLASGVYRAWLSQGDRVAATQIAAMLLLAIAALILVERLLRLGRRHQNPSESDRALVPTRLRGWRALAALVLCALPVLVGFVIPAARLVWLILGPSGRLPDARFWGLLANSLTLALIVGLLAVALALILVRERGRPTAPGRLATGIVALGYAVPGPVIAVGVLALATQLDRALSALFAQDRPTLLLTGSLALLVYACLVRYLAVALGPIRTALDRLAPSLEPAARSLGAGPWRRLRRIVLPLVAPSLAAAALIVFVDVLKELPMTFALRPFDFDTLAVRTFNLARDERFAEAATPSLVLVLVGLGPAILLTRRIRARR